MGEIIRARPHNSAPPTAAQQQEAIGSFAETYGKQNAVIKYRLISKLMFKPKDGEATEKGEWEWGFKISFPQNAQGQGYTIKVELDKPKWTKK